MDTLTINNPLGVFSMLEKNRLDITDRVVAKFKNNGMEIFDENEPIGKMVFTNQGNQYDLKSGYEYENNKFFHYTDVTTGADQKYTDCDDENGWC